MQPHFTVSEFLEIANETLDYAFNSVEIEGEIANYKVSKGRWVFFDLKDESGTINCFSTVYQLRASLENGMRVCVTGTPKLTDFGRFSFTLKSLRFLGEGTIKRAFELAKQKLEKEGLFSPDRKRPLPPNIHTIGVISSATAAGYKDFLKILSARWSGFKLLVADCGVQGVSALPGLISALEYFNESARVDIIVILRGGGSPDDLQIFNDENLTRKIATSRIPVVTGIGHEIDTTLADLAADLRASTPSNAAELISGDKEIELLRINDQLSLLSSYLKNYISTTLETNTAALNSGRTFLNQKITQAIQNLDHKIDTLNSLNPETVLKRGYAILTGSPSPGSAITIITEKNLITAEVKNVKTR